MLSKKSDTQALKRTVQLLRDYSDHYDWVGVYLVRENMLVLEAWAGVEHTEHTKIPIGQGICGLAAKENSTIIVPDVRKDTRYLMCFPSTRSEIVVPVRGKMRVLGEIDIDSNKMAAFTEQDRETLERTAEIIANFLEN